MPSKVLIEVANRFHARLEMKNIGIHGAEHLKIDQKEVMQHVRSLRDRFTRSVNSAIDTWKDSHLIRKRATFIDQNTLDLGDEQIKAKSIIIATGSKPIIPNPWKKYSDYFIDTDGFFELEDLPKKIAVIGLGVIGLELGQALNRLGVEVIGLTIGKALGGLSDPHVQNYAAQLFQKEFPISFEGADLIGEDNGQLVVESGSEQWKVDKVFLTMGRAPALTSLKLENLGVELNKRGMPEFSRSTFQIQDTNIFLTGDATGEKAILHEASDEGRIAGYNALRENKQCFKRRESIAVTFSAPNIAMIGQTHAQLINDKGDFVVGKVSFEGFGRAIVMLQEKGLCHIYADRQTGRLLGAEMVAPGGEHLAHLLAWVISLNLTVYEVLSLPFYHPVLEEALRTAFRDLVKQVQNEAPTLEVLRCQDAAVR